MLNCTVSIFLNLKFCQKVFAVAANLIKVKIVDIAFGQCVCFCVSVAAFTPC